MCSDALQDIILGYGHVPATWSEVHGMEAVAKLILLLCL